MSEQGIKTKELSLMTGIAENTYNTWFAGMVKRPSMGLITKTCYALGIETGIVASTTYTLEKSNIEASDILKAIKTVIEKLIKENNLLQVDSNDEYVKLKHCKSLVFELKIKER